MAADLEIADSDNTQLYLDLLKKTLRFSLWDDPGKPIEAISFRAGILSPLVTVVARLLARMRLRIMVLRDMEQERRMPGTTWPSWAHTMIGPARMDHLQSAVETVLRESIPGDLIETGVWRGGSCIFMKGILKAHQDQSRRLFVADSFEGLPKPNADKYPADKGDPHHGFSSFLAVSQEQVAESFRTFGLLDDKVVFLKGWFKDTLPQAPIEKLAIMRLDGDMYESTMDALTHLYDKLSPGGFCIIDDYFLPNCRAAVDEFRTQRGIRDSIVRIDLGSCYWRKAAN